MIAVAKLLSWMTDRKYLESELLQLLDISVLPLDIEKPLQMLNNMYKG
jgi:hypothetical protein